MIAKLAYAAVIAVTFTSPLSAQNIETWNEARAVAFTSVCLASAPSFDDVGKNAGNLGFRTSPEGLILDPEVVVSLQQTATDCSCYMTMGAPDQTALVTRIFQKMIADFGNDFRPDERELVNDTTFVREGQSVRVTLDPADIGGNPWIAGRVTREGTCQS